MNNNTFVFSKDALTDTEVTFDISALLKFGETLTSIVPQAVTPVTVPALVTTLLSAPTAPQVLLNLQGGQLNVSYGQQLLITTNARQITAQVAVTVISDVQVPYSTQNPEAYTDLVDTIEAGQAALGTAVFAFPPDVDPSGGYVNWEFMDSTGIVYANGNAFDYQIRSNGLSNIVFARSVITVPSTVPASAINTKYQLRYTLELPTPSSAQIDPANAPPQARYYSAENITVVGLNTVPMGTQDNVELQGNKATMSIVVDKMYDNVVVEIYQDNTALGSARITDFSRVANGYYFAGVFDTMALPVSLEPYTVVWNYSFTANPNEVFTESANLWITNPTIMGAVTDVKAKINKARTTLYGTPDLLFPQTVIMTWLRRARDAFNGNGGNFTTFTFTNAKGSVREYWLMYAEMFAIEAQYLAEGEKAFNFSGAAISLDVDRTSYLDSAASKIQSRLDNELKPFKQNLIIKGNTGGDGSADPSKLRQGAIGSVGITITPASPWGPYRSGLPYPTVFRG